MLTGQGWSGAHAAHKSRQLSVLRFKRFPYVLYITYKLEIMLYKIVITINCAALIIFCVNDHLKVPLKHPPYSPALALFAPCRY